MYVHTYVCTWAHTKYTYTYTHIYIPSFTKPVSHYSNNTRPSSRLKVQVIIQLHSYTVPH